MKKLILICLLAVAGPFVFSQQVSFNPVNLGQNGGDFAFLGITQDQMGYIWFTTGNQGVFRYDGTGFANFHHIDTNSNSLSGDYAECICADSSGIMWIGTFGKGLDGYNPISNEFIHFRHNARISTSLANDTVTAILEDREGNLWVGSFGGIDLLDRKSGIFKHYSHNTNNKSSLSSNEVRSIYQDRQGTIWIGCGEILRNAEDPEEGGLNRFNKKENNFTVYKHDPLNPKSLETNKVKGLFEDSRGNFWVGSSGNGLHIMDREKGTFTHYYYDSLHPENLSCPPTGKSHPFDHVTFINEDALGGIWIGSFSGGINRYDTVSKRISHYGRLGLRMNPLPTLARDTSFGFAGSNAWQALFTADGQIWFTTFRSFSTTMLYHVSLEHKGIPFYPTGKLGGANTFYDDADSLLWIGTDSGLIKKNTVLQTELLYKHDPKNPYSLNNNGIDVIRVDGEKNIWLGTYGGGLDKYDPITRRFTHFRFDATVKSNLSKDTIESMCLDHNNDVWVGTLQGLYKLDKKTGRFTSIKLENIKGNINNPLVGCIREDQSHELWVATDMGLYRVDIDKAIVTTVFPKAFTRSICVDAQNEIWISADTGGTSNEQSLYRLDRTRNQFVLYTDPNSGERVRNIFDIMEDDHSNLWISTSDAIFRINNKRDRLRRYGPGYGVHQNGFNIGDNFKAGNGKLYFGDSKGYYSFFPSELKDKASFHLNISSFKLNGKEVIPSASGILKKPIWRTNEIRLAHNENSFSFEFAAINYGSPGEVKLLFMMENYDDSWQSYGNGRRAYYFNMPPGTYTLHVKAFNEDGDLSEKSIRIIILSPWWKSWWAYLIFGLLVFASIWGFVNYRSRKIRMENLLLEKKVTLRTNQLNQSLEELKSTQAQLIQSEKMASLGELTAGIAHEIQNPLNFVNNFSEINKELLAEMNEEIQKGNLAEVKSIAKDIMDNEEKISTHGKRADAIVKGMLQHSRSSAGVKELTDINALADEYLRLSYHGLRAKDKSFNSAIKTELDPAVGQINIIPQDMGRLLLNIYNNAFYAVAEKSKQKPVGYEPLVSVTTKKRNGKVEIRIKDNGDGIPPKVKDKIFQPFFTTKPTGQGTGLGLSLSYDIVKAHGGEILIDTREGEFTEFIIQIPAV